MASDQAVYGFLLSQPELRPQTVLARQVIYLTCDGVIEEDLSKVWLIWHQRTASFSWLVAESRDNMRGLEHSDVAHDLMTPSAESPRPMAP